MGSRTPTTPPPPAPPRAVVARVRRFIVDHELIAPRSRVLVGLSGGPDSTCLLLVLAALRRSLGITLVAAHFDHQLRGPRAAARERRTVEALTDALGVPLERGAGDVRHRAKARKTSIEEAARELRYRFLADAARRRRCGVIAVGHTQDDQAETVLLHLLRGSGLRGLSGMAPSAPLPVRARARAPRLVRPLLCLSRDDTERACRASGVTPIEDSSNRSPAHLRNRIRHELLPVLRQYNPKIDQALVRLAAAAAADNVLLDELAARASARVSVRAGAVRLSRSRLAGLPAALQARALQLAVAQALGDARAIGERHLRALLRAAAGPTGAELHLPRGLRASVQRDALVLWTEPPAATRLPSRPVALRVPGATRFGRWRIEAEVLSRAPPAPLLRNGRYAAWLDARACGPRLELRRRRPGDRFHPLGLAQPKKLQDFLVNARVPRVERDDLPLLCSERGIAWVVGQRPAEWAKVTPSSRTVLRLSATSLDKRRGVR